MKRIMKVLPIMLVLVLAMSIVGFASASTTDLKTSTRDQLYIGDYEIDSRSGEAHIIFGYTSDATAEFGVVITDSENRKFLFQGNQSRIGANGIYGIAIYELPEGSYIAQSYSGAGDARVFGNEVPFTKGVSTYTVAFDLAGGEGTTPVSQTVAQGGNAVKPTETPESDTEFIGWVDENGAPFDFTAPVHGNITVYAGYEMEYEVEDPVYTLKYKSNGGGGYFGNATGANLTGGKSLVMEFNLQNTVPAKNLSVGFLMMDHAGSGNNYPYSVGRSAGWYTNYNYFDSRHVWAGKMSKDAITAAGAVFHENLFHMEKIFKGGKRIKAVYTSYTSTKGASIEIYTKDVGADDSTYTFFTSVTNIPSGAVPAENNVYLHWLIMGGVYDITTIDQTITEYRMYVVDGSSKTDVTSLAVGPNLIMTDIHALVQPVSDTKAGTIDRAFTIQGNEKFDGTEGGISYVFNKALSASDSITFEAIKGDGFEISLDYNRNYVSNSTTTLKADSIDYKYYKVYFDGTYATLAGRNADNVVWETVDKIGYQIDRFYAGFRMSSDTQKAKVAFLDNVVYNVGGTAYTYYYDDNMAVGFSQFTDTSASKAYILDEEYEVKFVLYNGEVLETQTVSYMKDATLPAGTWVNAESALAQASKIENDTVIWLVREGDNIGGNYVNVIDGTLTNDTIWTDDFAVFKKGDQATVVADTKEYAFAGWSDGESIVSTSATYTFTVQENTRLTATYDIPKYTVSVVNGTIDGIAETTAKITLGTNITVVADDIANKVFQGWSDGTSIVSADKNYSFAVSGNIVLTATYKDAYTVNIDMTAVGGTTSQQLLEGDGLKATAPSISNINTAPTNGRFGWVDEEGKEFSFDTVITRDIDIRGVWIATDSVANNAYKLVAASKGAHAVAGSDVPVDLSDGSTLNMEFDISASTIPVANYNLYVWLRSDNTNYGSWSGNYYGCYANYMLHSPWAGKYLAQDNITNSGVTLSNGWNPVNMFAANQSVKISYTAPTDETTGSIVYYVKALSADEWTVLASITNITMANVQDTSSVYMAIDLENSANNYPTITFENFRMYVNDGYSIPALASSGAALSQITRDYEVNFVYNGSTVSSETVTEGYTVTSIPTITATAPKGGVIEWFDAEGNVFTKDTVIEGPTTVTAKWIADPTIKATTYKYHKTTSDTGRSNIGASVPVDLSKGGSIYMEMDVLSGLSNTNFQFSTIAFGWLPNLESTNEGLSGVGYTGFAGNPAYTSSSTSYYGYVLRNGPDTFDGSKLSYGPSHNDADQIYATGKTVRVVYTAPTSTTDGSIIYYQKSTGAADSTFVEMGAMRGIQLADVWNTNSVYLWLDIYVGMTWAKPTMTFTNFHIYSDVYGADLPVVFYNRASTEITEVDPKYTVNFVKDGTSVDSQEVKKGETVTAPSVSATAPLGGTLVWVDANGDEFDFDTPIEHSMTLTAKMAADPEVKASTYSVSLVQGGTASLMSSVASDLSDGGSISYEMDVISASGFAANAEAGVDIWYYLPTHGTINRWFGGFADNKWRGNSAYTPADSGYVGVWKVEDYSSDKPTFGTKFIPGEIWVAGKTVKATYTAPTDSVNGSLYIYTKTTGADDSTYTVAASATDITKKMVGNTASVYFGLYMCGAQTAMTLEFTNWHVFTEDGDIPALFDFNDIVLTKKETVVTPDEYSVIFKSNDFTVGETTVEAGAAITAPASVPAPTGATLSHWVNEDGETVDLTAGVQEDSVLSAVWTYPTYKIGIDKTTESGTKAGWLMTGTATASGTGEKLTFEMDVISSNLSSYNINVGISIFNGLGVSNNYASGFYDSQYIANGVNSSSSWKVEDVSNKTAPTKTALNIGAIWKAGNSVKVVYTMPTSTATGSIVVYTKATTAAASAYAEVASCTGIAQDMVVNSGSKVMLGMIFQSTQKYNAFPHMVVTNLRTYNESTELQFVAQHLLTFEEVEA